MIEAESAVPEGLGHVVDVVFAQDVESKATGAGHDARILADAAFVLVVRDIANMVVAVLNAPMTSNGGCPFGCRQTGGGRNVEGDLAALIPQAGSGRVKQGVAGDADDGLDEGLPPGFGQSVADWKDLDGPIFLAGSALVPRNRSVGRSIVIRDGAGDFEQIGLVRLHLDQEMVAGVTGNFECFFDSAWRRE